MTCTVVKKRVTLGHWRQYIKLIYKDHQLSGNYKHYRECHIEPDWLLMYKIENYELQLARVGSHSELFG